MTFSSHNNLLLLPDCTFPNIIHASLDLFDNIKNIKKMTRKDQINLIGKNLSNILNTKDYEKWIHVKQHLAEQGVIVEITTENKGKYFLNRIEKIGPSTIKSESEQIPQSRWERFKDRVISPLKKDQTKTATALN